MEVVLQHWKEVESFWDVTHLRWLSEFRVTLRQHTASFIAVREYTDADHRD